jgi:hypothetical protein
MQTNQSERSPWMLRRHALYEHVRLWGDNRWVDEPQEEETADKRAYGMIRRLRVLSLQIAMP